MLLTLFFFFLVFIYGIYLGRTQVFVPSYAAKVPCCVCIDIESVDAIQALDELIVSLKLTIKKKELLKDSGYKLNLAFDAPFLVQHVFIKRLYALDGLGRIIKI